MKIANIYEEYKIPKVLQLHMYRVASVARLICDNWEGDIERDVVIQAALLHDMGNIIKFNMSFMPEVFEPEGVEYWSEVKDEFIQKYGSDEHLATYKIIEDIGVSNRIMDVVKGLGFSRSKEVYESESFELKICQYSDQRVSPTGVLSLEERIEEGYKRFLARKDWPKTELDKFPILAEFLRKIEGQIFKQCKIKPEDINDKEVASIIEELKSFEIITK